MTKEDLKQELRRLNFLYRVGSPEVSDDVYDDLLEKFESLCTTSEYQAFRQSLLEPLRDSSNKFAHFYKVGSLEKIKKDEFSVDHSKMQAIKGKPILVTPKIDGNSIVLYYIKGKLEYVVTRGDGIVGEVVNQLKPVFPDTLSREDVTLVIRGELVIHDTDFDYIKSTKPEYTSAKNPRNLVAGIIHRTKSFDESLLEFLHFYAFEIMGSTETQVKQFISLTKYADLEVVPYFKLDPDQVTVDKLSEILDTLKTTLPYNIDGLVINPIDYTFENVLLPKARVAFKENYSEVKETVVKDVIWETSKTGKVVPLAEIEPVELNGTTVSKVALHNLRNVKKIQISKGARVSVYKAGEIIPAIKEVLEVSRESSLDIPKTCPSCGSTLETTETDLVCNNPNCTIKKLKETEELIKRLKVKGLTKKSLENLGIVSIKDLIEFKKPKAKSLKIYNIIDTIQDKLSSMTELELLYVYPFNNISTKVLLKIMSGYNSLEEYLSDTSKTSKTDIIFRKQIDGFKTFVKLVENLKKNKRSTLGDLFK